MYLPKNCKTDRQTDRQTSRTTTIDSFFEEKKNTNNT